MTMKLKESDLVEQSSTIESNNDCNDGNSSVHSLHSNLLLESNLSVLLKYKVVAELGEGSMGTVSKVRLRNRRITPTNGGGSGSGRASPSGGASVNSNGSNGAAAAPPPSPPSVGGYFQGLKVFRTATLKQNYKTHFYAMKQIKMNQLSDVFKEEIKNEIAILRSLDHPNIVRIFEIYHYDQNVDVICELCDGGDLYARFPYSQKEAAKITSKLLSAVKYMHDHNVVHRDLKFENIMFEDKSKDAEIKVIDFGLSKILEKRERERTTECVGTIDTMAPEVLRGVHSSKADMWSVGVIAFMLLSGKQPFFHYVRKKMEESIKKADYTFNNPAWKKVGEDAKDFVSKLLVVDESERLSADTAIKHPFIANRALNLTKDDKLSDESLRKIHESIVRYKDVSDLKKLALNIIAHRSSPSETVLLRKAFDLYDSTSRDGVLDFDEFKFAIMSGANIAAADAGVASSQKKNYDDDAVREIFHSIDVNKNGHIQYTEFLAATVEAHGPISENRITEAFDRLDSDSKGFITDEDLHQILTKDYTLERLMQIIEECDTDLNGEISFEEFKAIFRPPPPPVVSSDDKKKKKGATATGEPGGKPPLPRNPNAISMVPPVLSTRRSAWM